MPPNPWWSERVQNDFNIEQRRPIELSSWERRPIELSSWEAPVPHDDDDLDDSPQHDEPSGSGADEKESGVQFQTPADSQRQPLADGEKPHEPELKVTEETEHQKPLQDGASWKRWEGTWKRRSQVEEKPRTGDTGNQKEREKHETGDKRETDEKRETGLEDALGDQVLQHFQNETMRLQTQNDMLLKEIQKLKDERQQGYQLFRRHGMSVLHLLHHLKREHHQHLSCHSSSGCPQRLFDVLPLALGFHQGHHLQNRPCHPCLSGLWTCSTTRFVLSLHGNSEESWGTGNSEWGRMF